MSRLHVLALFMGCVLLVLAPNVPKGQQRKDSMTLLTTTPHSMEEKGVLFVCRIDRIATFGKP